MKSGLSVVPLLAVVAWGLALDPPATGKSPLEDEVAKTFYKHQPQDSNAVEDTVVTGFGKIFPNATRMTIRNGPIKVFAGRAHKHFGFNFTKPSDEYVILAASTSLQDKDGNLIPESEQAIRSATIFTEGPTLPAIKFGRCSKAKRENFFQAWTIGSHGIHYAPQDLSVKTGVHVNKEDTVNIEAFIFNEQNEDKEVWLTHTYEYLPGKHPDFKHSLIDIIGKTPSGCQVSANPSQKQPVINIGSNSMRVASVPVRAQYSGKIVKAKAWLASLPAWVDLQVNGRMVCTSHPGRVYLSTPEDDDEGVHSLISSAGMDMEDGPKVRFWPIETTECHPNATVKRGDKLRVIGYYGLDRNLTVKETVARTSFSMSFLLSA